MSQEAAEKARRRRRRRKKSDAETSGLAAPPERVEACEGESEAPSEVTEYKEQWESTESTESSEEDRGSRLRNLREAESRLADVADHLAEATDRVLAMDDVSSAQGRIDASLAKSRQSSSATEADARIRAIDDGLASRRDESNQVVRRQGRKFNPAVFNAFRFGLLLGPPRAFDGELFPAPPPRPKR